MKNRVSSSLEKEKDWIISPINKATDQVQKTEFFTEWLLKVKSSKDFAPAATQLYQHSVEFPKTIALMLSTTPQEQAHMMPFFAGHIKTEAPHNQWLLNWIIEQKIFSNKKDVLKITPTAETTNCINFGNDLAKKGDIETWLVAMNSGIELCSNKFFSVVANKMRTINAAHKYFDVHVEADEYHSVMGLKYLSNYEDNPARRKALITKALEAISLWAAMINSWAGVQLCLKFDLDGNRVD